MDKFLIETTIGDCVYLGTTTKPLLILKEYTGTDPLADVTISSTTEIIFDEAFKNKIMNSLTLGAGITKIKKDAFKGAAITTLNYSSSSGAINTWCAIEFENYYSNPLSVTTSRKIAQFNNTTLDINSATTINAYAFVNYNINTVKFGTALRYVNKDAFLNCDITNTVITSSITNWYNINFESATSNPIFYSHNLYVNSVSTDRLVTRITITQNLRDYAFINLTSLESATMGEATNFIGHAAFQGCINLHYETELNQDNIVVAKYLIGTNNSRVLMYVDAQAMGDYKLTNEYGGINIDLNVNISGYLDTNKTILARYDGEIVDTTVFILNNAFNSSNITNITIPDSVIYIGEGAFKNCTNLNSEIIISNAIVKIGDRAFENSGITKITFYARALNQIPSYMCLNCQSLTEMEIISGASIGIIGKQAFAYCTNLQKVILPSGNTALRRIEDQAFLQCRSLGEDFAYPLVLANNVAYIGKQAFFDCNRLQKIEIYANNTIVIKKDSFACCFGIVEVYAPNFTNDLLLGSPSWGYLGYYAAEIINDSAEKDVNQLHVTSDGVIIYGKEINGEIDFSTASIVGYQGNESSIILPEVKRIKPYSFYNNKELINITLQNNNNYLVTIGAGAFDKCDKLHFTEENGLLYLSTPDNPYFALISYNTQYTDALTSITINSNTRFIYQGALYGLNNVISIISNTSSDRVLLETDLNSMDYHPPFSTIFGKEYYGNLSQVSASHLLFYSSNNELYSSIYYVPKSLTMIQIKQDQMISHCAFKGCSELTSVILPAQLTILGSEAFDGCIGLTSIILPNTLTDIETGAFNGISAEIYWGDNPIITTLKEYALQNYQGEELVIPNSVTKISQCALYGCNKLIKLYIPFVGYQKNYGSGGVLLGHDFGPYQYDDAELTRQTTINWSSSSTTWSESISRYYIPLSLREVYVTSNGAVYNGAFSRCSHLTKVWLNSNISSVGVGIFNYCASLESVTLPFVGENKTTTALSRRVAFGSLFSQSNFEGATSVQQFYSTSGTTSKMYYIPTTLTDVVVTGGTLQYTFENCSMLVNIVTNNITYVNAGICNNCSNLKNLTLNVSPELTMFNNISASNKGLIENCNKLNNLTLPFVGDRRNRGVTRDVYTVLGALYSTSGSSELRITQYCGYQSGSTTSYILLNPYVSPHLNKIVLTQESFVPFGGFSGFNQVQIIELNEGITEIEQRGFYNCAALTTVNIPLTLTTIGREAFANTVALTTLNYNGTMAEWGSITLSPTWKDGSALTTVHCTDGDITL